jgi:hypothetical protein
VKQKKRSKKLLIPPPPGGSSPNLFAIPISATKKTSVLQSHAEEEDLNLLK